MKRPNAFEWVLNIPWMLVSARECLWVIVNSPWTPIECAWMPMSDCEQPLNTHWVCLNAIEWVWTPIEYTCMPLSYYWTWLTVVWQWERMHLCENWTAPECDWVHLNTAEWVLNTSWMLLSAREHLWVSINALNACECMWMPLSEYWRAPEPIECAWTPLSKYLEGLNAHL